MLKVNKVSKNEVLDVTEYAGNLSLRSNIDEISDEVNFEMISGEIDLYKCIFNVGDIITLNYDNKEIFRGMVREWSKNNRSKFTIKANDFGWYLNKSENAYQFKGTVSDNIKKICNEFGVPIGNIVNIPTKYNKITRGNLKSIIKEMLELAGKEQGKEYYIEMRKGKFYVDIKNSVTVHYSTDNIYSTKIDITELYESPSRTVTLDGMYNAVKAVQQAENTFKVLAYAEDKTSISKFGKIQKLEALSKEDINKASSIVKNQLKKLNKMQEKTNVKLLGNIECKAGKVLEFDEKVFGIQGKYSITNCTHNFTSKGYTMDVGLELISR